MKKETKAEEETGVEGRMRENYWFMKSKLWSTEEVLLKISGLKSVWLKMSVHFQCEYTPSTKFILISLKRYNHILMLHLETKTVFHIHSPKYSHSLEIKRLIYVLCTMKQLLFYSTDTVSDTQAQTCCKATFMNYFLKEKPMQCWALVAFSSNWNRDIKLFLKCEQ